MKSEWHPNPKFKGVEEYFINGEMVAWLEPRPAYCDRGHWQVNCRIEDLNGADGFPRYYMCKETAIAETEAFINWRLFKMHATGRKIHEPRRKANTGGAPNSR